MTNDLTVILLSLTGVGLISTLVALGSTARRLRGQSSERVRYAHLLNGE